MAPGPATEPEQAAAPAPSTPSAFVHDAVVLAGGTGERLGGVSKADVVLHGERLLDPVLRAAAGARQVVVVGDVAVPDGVLLTREDPPHSGPAAGIAAGLDALTDPSPFVLVLACDLATPEPAVMALLRHAATAPGTPDGYGLADAEGRPQWLLGLYRRESLDRALTALGDPRNRSVRRLMSTLDLSLAAPDDGLVADIDTWEDHARAAGDRQRVALADVADRSGPWITAASVAVGTDPALVDVVEIHALAGEIARCYDRPMAPVGAYLLGLARASGVTEAGLTSRIVDSAGRAADAQPSAPTRSLDGQGSASGGEARRMRDLDESGERWAAWVVDACSAVGVDPADVDIETLLTMTKQIAHGFERPMAPVGAYVLGLAVGAARSRGDEVDLTALRRTIVATLPPRTEEPS